MRNGRWLINLPVILAPIGLKRRFKLIQTVLARARYEIAQHKVAVIKKSQQALQSWVFAPAKSRLSRSHPNLIVWCI